MASAAGTVVGFLLGGPLGAFIGGTLGAIADRAIFQPSGSRAHRLDELQLSTANEGAPVYRCFGPSNRIPATVIWTGPVVETAADKKGGCGGPKGPPGYTYSIDTALAACTGPIDGIERILANGGTVLYDDDPDVTVSASTDIALDVVLLPGSFGAEAQLLVDMVLTATSDGPNLGLFQTGQDVTVSGFADSDNNGTWPCIGSATDSATSTVTLRWGSYAPAFPPSNLPSDEAAGTAVTLDQTNPEFSPKHVSDVTIYTGTDSQSVDPTIEGHEGTGNVPAYRGLAYAVLTSLNLGPAPVFPNLNLIVRATVEPATLATALASLLEDAGLTAAQYDVSEVTGNLRGFAVAGPSVTAESLLALLVTHDLVVQEDSGVLRFREWTDLDTVAIDADDLAAHERGSDAPRPARWGKGETAPAEVDVRYLDSTNENQPGSQRDRGRNNVDRPRDSLLQLDTPEVLTPSEARTVARRVRLTLKVNEDECEVRIPPGEGVRVIEGDILTFTHEGESYLLSAQRVSTGWNGITVVHGQREELHTHSISAQAAEDATGDEPTLDFPSPFVVLASDLAPLREADCQTPGYYHGAAQLDPSALFSGAALFSAEDGTTYEPVALIPAEATVGYTTSALPAGVTNVWDTTSTVDVTLHHGQLSSASADEVIAGRNMALLGNEVIGFQTATLAGGMSYTLSDLLRGARGTEGAVGAHTATEGFLLLEHLVTERFIPVTLGDVGEEWSFKAAEQGANLDDETAYGMTVTGGTVTPFAPYGFTGTRTAGGDLTIEWRPRTRALVGIWTDADVPLYEESEDYELDILNGSSTVVRTFAVSGSRSTGYSAAEQTTDGLTPGDPVSLLAYQISSRGLGRGREAAVTV